jgi:hypothetical protein
MPLDGDACAFKFRHEAPEVAAGHTEPVGERLAPYRILCGFEEPAELPSGIGERLTCRHDFALQLGSIESGRASPRS